MSTSDSHYPQESEGYVRTATGKGQVLALRYIIPDLESVFGRAPELIKFSNEQIGNPYDRDLVLVGGQNTNRLSKEFLGGLSEFPVTIDKSGFIWDGERFDPILSGNSVLEDFGIVVKAPNSKLDRTTAVMFSGFHTYGTAAAAKYFTETLAQNP